MRPPFGSMADKTTLAARRVTMLGCTHMNFCAILFRRSAPAWIFASIFLFSSSVPAEWRVLTAGDQRQTRPPKNLSNAAPIKPGDHWPTDNKFRWLIGELEIPET